MPVSAPTPKQEATKTTTTPARLRELAELSPELAKLVAKNPNTSPDFLKELGSHSDAAIRKNVVGNPNTPPEVLLKLAGQFPGQLLDNPVFDLLLLENPNFLANLSESSLRSLLKRDIVPESFLEWAANHKDGGVLMAVVMNPSTPKSALEIIVENCRRKGASKLIHPSNHPIYFDCLRQWHSAELLETATLHVNWTEEIAEGWHEIAKAAMQTTMLDHNRDTAIKLWKIGAMPDVLLPALHQDPQLKIAENLETNASALAELTKDWKHMLKIRQAIAKHPNTPVAILEKLMGDQSAEVRMAAIQNPKTPFLLQQQFQMQLGTVEHPNTCAVQLQKLATSQWAHIRLGVAGHPHTSAAVLEQLAQDTNALVRTAVVLNANTPSPALEKLANDPDYWLRKGVGCHPNVTIPLLEKLALDDTPNGPREAVALNPKTPLSLLQELMQNSKLYNHFWLEQNLKSRTEQIPEMYLNQIPSNLMSLISEIPTCRGIPEGMQRGFFCLKEPPSPTNLDLLGEMAQSPNKRTLWLVSLNPATPVSGLMHIANTADQWTSKRAVLTLTQKSETSAEVLQQLIRQADWAICVAIACHPNISDEGLEQLAQRQEWQVRMTVAKHPKSPSNLLEKLAHDKEGSVRQAIPL
ncbi:MAG: hypothetical protein HC852_19855 [Acaryochloridaceae cyanobacterium RU_4_10]|nr:hypothetical protein [Acaryochloridaceae cyanobacterium RU_4_10]